MSELASGASCAICMSPVEPSDAWRPCESCRAPYHEECWSENGGCAVYGCARVPKTEGLKPLEIPPAFWGKEDKECPRCGASIMALAVRCRHCGTEVQGRPEEKAAFEKRAERRTRTPFYRRAAIIFLIMSLLPVASLVTLIAGGLYYASNRKEIARLPGGTEGLFRIALVTAAAQVSILLFGLAAWWIRFVVFE